MQTVADKIDRRYFIMITGLHVKSLHNRLSNCFYGNQVTEIIREKYFPKVLVLE